MSVLIAASAARTCLGSAEETFAALRQGRSGIGRLRYLTRDVNVRYGYHISEPGPESPLRASRWLGACVAEAVARSGIDPRRQRVACLVATGLRELRTLERWAVDGVPLRAEQLHFSGAVRAAVPGLPAAVTISNACSAAGYALALAQDLIELGEADAALVAAADSMTESMLAMIGRFSDQPTTRLRPFDVDRTGTLLGEGAAAVVLVPEGYCGAPAEARVLGTGLSCDAHHETAPDAAGIRRAIVDAGRRAGRELSAVDVIFAHGTGTALNDPTEAAVLGELFAPVRPGPLVTAVKGALGHTSGASPLTSLTMAVHSLREGVVPPVVGLDRPIPEASGLRLVTGAPKRGGLRCAQVNAFGFGGVNAVTLVERV